MDLINQIDQFEAVSHLVIQYLFIALALIIGLIVTIEDFRFDKIRNKWVITGLLGGLILNVGSIVFYLITKQGINWLSYSDILINTLIAFIFGFILWHFKIWAGGDAKLFTLYVFLIPFTCYAKWLFVYWPPLNLLINISFPIFIYLVIKFLNLSGWFVN